MSRFTILFSLLFCTLKLSAQNIHGIVTGDGKPLSNVTITMSDKDSVILDRTISDSVGSFRFNNIDRSEVILYAKCLGYKSKSIRIETKDDTTCNLPLHHVQPALHRKRILYTVRHRRRLLLNKVYREIHNPSETQKPDYGAAAQLLQVEQRRLYRRRHGKAESDFRRDNIFRYLQPDRRQKTDL